MKVTLLLCLWSATFASWSPATPTITDLQTAFDSAHWNEAVEMANEILAVRPHEFLPKVRGAYALFQLGYANSALALLQTATPAEWSSLPLGQDRLVEIVSLFQKKVPPSALPARMSDVKVELTSSYLKDEVNFTLGREAFERSEWKKASDHFLTISPTSRYWTEASYLLGCIAVKEKRLEAASSEFSKVFQPAVYDQSTEFWRDFSTEMSSHWGPNLRVFLDSSPLSKTKQLAELATLAEARVAYARKRYDQALEYYERLTPQSTAYKRATLEKIWTLLALNQHNRAAQVAATLSLSDTSWEAIEAKTLRALILTDSGKTSEARLQLDSFFNSYEKARDDLQRYRVTFETSAAPVLANAEIDEDKRFWVLKSYIDSIQTEIDKLKLEDQRVFPVFGNLAANLQSLLIESRSRIAQLTEGHVAMMLAKLEKLYIQAKLIKAETYLEDREQLRQEFAKAGEISLDKQREHDSRLVALLESAVNEVDEASAKPHIQNLNLDFRQSELLWELSNARGILAQANGNKEDEKFQTLRNRSLAIARNIITKHPEFTHYSEALFFAGFAENEMGQNKQGIATLKNFLDRFPSDARAPDAHRIVADDDFDNNRFAAAEKSYRAILAFPDSPVVGYALYTLAWCAYNQKNFPGALLALEQAVHWSERFEQNQQLLTLKREAKRDLVSIFAEVGDYHKAPDYFRKFMGGEASPWILELAKALDKQGQYEKSAELYRNLIKTNPGAAQNLSYGTSIIWGDHKLHQWDGVLVSTKELLDRYSSVLQSPQPENTDAGHTEKVIREVVMDSHREFQTSTNKEDIVRVGQLDDLYLQTFQKWPSAEAPLYAHADFLVRNKDFTGAVKAYTAHLSQYETTLTASQKEESLRNLIHSLEQVEALPKKEVATDLSPVAKELLGRVDEYLIHYPSTKYARAVAFLGSVIQFKYNLVDKGIQSSQSLFNQNPKDDFGKRSFQNLRVAYYKKADWEATYLWAKNLSSQKIVGAEAYADDLRTIRRESMFLWAQNTSDDLKSGNLFIQVASEPEMQPLWQKSFYNAFIRYQKAGKKIEAVKAADQLQQMFPKSEFLVEIAGLRAAMYQEAGDYPNAFLWLEEFLNHPGKEATPKALQQARLNAALIAEATARTPRAETLFKAYLADQNNASSSGLAEANRGLLRLSRKNSRGLAAVPAHYSQLLKAQEDFVKQPIATQGELAERIKKGGQRLEALAKELFALSDNAKTSLDVAYESYCAVPPLYSAYQKAMEKIGKNLNESLRAQLLEIAGPLGAKAKDLAQECLKRSVQVEHDGPMYRAVLNTWGWKSDPEQVKKADRLLSELEKHYPWMVESSLTLNESELINLNLQDKGNEESWYALAKIRCDHGQMGLCRLTLIDALSKAASSGKIVNLLALVELRSNPDAGISALFTQASKLGDTGASANLAVYHLRAARLEAGVSAFETAVKGGLFAEDPNLTQLANEWAKP